MVNQSLNHLVDGIPVDSVPVTNRGLAYGDGVFETILFFGMQPVLWDQHVERLRRGCHTLGLQIPQDLEQQLLEQCGRLLESNASGSSVVKIIVTRASDGRGYRPSTAASVQTILSIYPGPEYPAQHYHQGINLWLCHAKLSANQQLAGIKHLARLEQVLAAMEWPEPEYQEGLMLEGDNHVVEGTRSNIFMETGGELVTPTLALAGVAGVMRDFILGCADQIGVRVRVRPVSLEEFELADGAFVCNSVFGIWPVSTVRLAANKVVSWQPARLTRLVQRHVFQTLKLGVFQ